MLFLTAVEGRYGDEEAVGHCTTCNWVSEETSAAPRKRAAPLPCQPRGSGRTSHILL